MKIQIKLKKPIWKINCPNSQTAQIHPFHPFHCPFTPPPKLIYFFIIIYFIHLLTLFESNLVNGEGMSELTRLQMDRGEELNIKKVFYHGLFFRLILIFREKSW